MKKLIFFTLLFLYLVVGLSSGTDINYIAVDDVDQFFYLHVIEHSIIALVIGFLIFFISRKMYKTRFVKLHLLLQVILPILFSFISYQLNKNLLIQYNCTNIKTELVFDGYVSNKIQGGERRQSRNSYYLSLMQQKGSSYFYFKVSKKVYDKFSINDTIHKSFYIGLFNIIFRKEE